MQVVKKPLSLGAILFIIYLIVKFLLLRPSPDTIRAQQEMAQEATAEMECHRWTNAKDYVGTYTCIRGPVSEVINNDAEFKIILSLGNDDIQSAILGNFVTVEAISREFKWENISKGYCLYVWGTLSQTSNEKTFRLDIDSEKGIREIAGGC